MKSNTKALYNLKFACPLLMITGEKHLPSKKNTKNLNWEKIIIEGDRNYKYIVDENKNKIKMAQISSMWGTRGTKENRIQSKLLSQKNWTISPIQINVPNIGTGVTYLS